MAIDYYQEYLDKINTFLNDDGDAFLAGDERPVKTALDEYKKTFEQLTSHLDCQAAQEQKTASTSQRLSTEEVKKDYLKRATNNWVDNIFPVIERLNAAIESFVPVAFAYFNDNKFKIKASLGEQLGRLAARKWKSQELKPAETPMTMKNRAGMRAQLQTERGSAEYGAPSPIGVLPRAPSTTKIRDPDIARKREFLQIAWVMRGSGARGICSLYMEVLSFENKCDVEMSLSVRSMGGWFLNQAVFSLTWLTNRRTATSSNEFLKAWSAIYDRYNAATKGINNQSGVSEELYERIQKTLQKIISFIITRKNEVEEECERLSKWGRVPDALNALKESYNKKINELDEDENLKDFLYPQRKATTLKIN